LYKLAIVLRLLRKRKITIFPVAGVMLGVMALVVVLSVMEGFDTDFRNRIRALVPDLSLDFRNVFGYSGDKEHPVSELVKRIESVPEVRAASPYVSGLALCVAHIPSISESGVVQEQVVSSYATFKGFDFDRENAVLDFTGKHYLEYGKNEFPLYSYGGENTTAPFIAGSRLVGRKFEDVRSKETDWGVLDKGARVEALTFFSDYTRSKINGVVVDVISSGIYDLDAHTLFMPIEWARSFRGIGKDGITGVGIALKKYDRETAAAAKAHIRAALGDVVSPLEYRLDTWEESRETFLKAVAMERRIMAFILFFFLVVAGFSIAAILIMIVLEKVRDIGILRAMGASRSGTAGIFLTYGVTIGLVGAAIGLALGVAFVKNIDVIESGVYNATGWQPFPPDIYDLPAIPRILDWWTNLYIVITALGVSFVASVLPAVRAAWLDPVEAIRYE